MNAFPWANVMQFGFGVLKLSPEALWTMTPRELAAAMRGGHAIAAGPLGRDELTRLMERFPDGR
ncbi:phage tail assembly chaperone [Devosia rhodophyticola]|uniref:Phage tail assembly chaperone n=1 Tax=Devosia rhodophyticola TaxID=3026423 RepID=A0ABY7YYT2_9HYPH|nr:rcc01693 family protein [Devosia rhodophyticola]WDR06397.1 phage tail assembly chaperone [Devosia rhodophyticola]